MCRRQLTLLSSRSFCRSSICFGAQDDQSTKPVVTEKYEGVFMVGLNRPEKRNCVNTETRELLFEAFREFENDKESAVAILYGKGGNFCAGMDLAEVSKMESLDEVPRTTVDKGPMGPTRMLASKPVIAAVNGYAVAGGFELALLCDLRVVEESAIMGVFCRRFGVPLIDGGTVRLPQLIGLSRALDLILTGRGIDGKEAYEMGLSNRLVETGTALGGALSLARSLVKFPLECMLADRRSAYYSTFDAKSMSDAFQFEQQNSEHVLLKESVQGAKRFVEGIGRHGSFKLESIEKLKEC